MKNEVKIILFAGLIAAMILPFSAMDLPEAFGMQHVMKIGMHFHHKDMNISVEKITNDSTQMLRDSKATSFNEVWYFEKSPIIDEIRHIAHRR